MGVQSTTKHCWGHICFQISCMENIATHPAFTLVILNLKIHEKNQVFKVCLHPFYSKSISETHLSRAADELYRVVILALAF